MLCLVAIVAFPWCTRAQTLTDVTNTSYEKAQIHEVLAKAWMLPLTPTTFGYGIPIKPDEWFFMLMFLRTSDACPELGMTSNQYWTADNIRACLSGVGVPVVTELPDQVRRDEAMQQLFALRRRSFAFQELQTKPAGFIDPADLTDILDKRVGAMIAGDRLKLIFRKNNKLLPASPLLREDAALSVSRFLVWEKQGGTDKETNDQQQISKEATLNHWRDLDTDIYVLQVKTGGDTTIRPILPRRSFNPAKEPTKEELRDEFVYQPVSEMAQESGALAAINGSYFNIEWPWGAFEDVVMLKGKMLLERTDRSTFIVCKDGKMFIGKYQKKQLDALKCLPEHALGAGPLFLAHGKVLTESPKESFDEYTQWERRVGKNARTAVAISADRKTAYLIIVAGKSYPAFGRGGSSLGVFLKDKYPDIAWVMMYDGGTSTALYTKGELLVGSGVSGEDAERAVVSALGVFSKKAEEQALKQFKKDQAKYWDKDVVNIKVERPKQAFVWSDDKPVKMANDKASGLQLMRHEKIHERGWKIPLELHAIDAKRHVDVDIIKLFSFVPDAQRPDLKTLDVLTTRPTGVVLGDASGRAWFYYAKGQQLSPAKFKDPPKVISKKAKK